MAFKTSEYFLEMFWNNLLDIEIDPTPYGTHSFRCGGCLWMSVDLCWNLCTICEWGGWSMELTNLTIVKYLISSNLCKRLLQAQQGRVLPFAMEIVFIVFYLHG